MTNTEQRRQKLRRLVKKANVDGILVTNFTNVTYLTGFSGDDSFLLVTRDKDILLSDPRYTEQIQEECPGLELAIRGPGVKMATFLAKVIGESKTTQLAVESLSMTVSMWNFLKETLAAVELAPTEGLVEQLREIKDKSEIVAIRGAVDTAQRAFSVIRASLRDGQPEKEVAHAIEQQIRWFGGSGCSFPPIVAVGPRAALPHAVPGDQEIGESDFVLIDWGAHQNLYMSDLTRILVTGRISPKLERIYGVVLNAQQAAIEAVRPGAVMHDVDAAARNVIAEAGYGKRFGHSLGHGIGLEIHEGPRLAQNEYRPLKAGMVITIEPGIYLPGWGGVRIEDDLLVTRDGCEVLTTVPKELVDCVIG